MSSHTAAGIQAQHHFLAEKVETVSTNLKFPSGNDDLKDQLQTSPFPLQINSIIRQD